MPHRSSPRGWRWLPAAMLIAASWSSAQQPDRACTSTECATIDASQLRRVKIVNPAYPRVAKENQISGAVDLQFTVQPDGSTAAIEVIKAEPLGVFEASAIAALAQWRYLPVVRDGKPVAQQAVVRIKFAL